METSRFWMRDEYLQDGQEQLRCALAAAPRHSRRVRQQVLEELMGSGTRSPVECNVHVGIIDRPIRDQREDGKKGSSGEGECLDSRLERWCLSRDFEPELPEDHMVIPLVRPTSSDCDQNWSVLTREVSELHLDVGSEANALMRTSTQLQSSTPVPSLLKSARVAREASWYVACQG